VSTIWNDLRYAFRQLRKSPGFTLTAVLTLALGIGANTAVFTLVHAVMLKSLPVADPQQLYQVGNNDKCCTWGGFQDSWALYSYDFYQHMRANTPAFEELAAFQANNPTVSVRRSGTNAPADPFGSEFVSGNYFSTFGIQPFTGRLLTDADDTPGSAPAAVISYHAWADKFGLDRSVIGGIFLINGKPFTIVGVTPPGFYGDSLRSDPPEFYMPLNQEPHLVSQQDSVLRIQDEGWLYAVGRMKPGQNPKQVGAQLTIQLQHWLVEHVPLINDRKERLPKQQIVLGPGGAGITHMRHTFHRGLWLLTAASALVLLIACANLANLQLVRSTARRHQGALRLALGASRRRLIRGALAESVLLALMGGIAGVLVAYAATRGILLLLFRGATYVPIDASPSLLILAFAFALSLFTGVLFGIAPALVLSRSNPVEALRGANRSTRDHSALPQKMLVIFQAAFSLVLLAMAGLVTQSLQHMEGGNFGFQPSGRLIVEIDPQAAGYKPEDLTVLYRTMLDRLHQIPGVRSVGLSTWSPQDGDDWNDSIVIEGHPRDDRDQRMASWVRISPEYFQTIGTPLLRGRGIAEQDTATSEHVAVIDEAFAKTYFPNEDPIGKHFGHDVPSHAGDYTIVGIVKTSRYQHAMLSQNPMFFVPLTQAETFQHPLLQHWEVSSHFVRKIEFRVAGGPAQYGPAIRNALASIDPNLTVIALQSMSEQVDRLYDQERLTARLTELFGLLALLLASIGIYGVTAYNVAGRTSEIGIRMALGADRASVVRRVLRGALVQIGIGLAIGLPLAVFAGRLVASQLYDVGKFDAVVLLSAVLVLAVCAVIAGFLPAKRAASVEPMEALRTE
jgi:predicted permease